MVVKVPLIGVQIPVCRYVYNDSDMTTIEHIQVIEMKRKTAKEILTASFQEIAAVKGIDKITIQEIVDNCGYSPATFYRHFKDKYDLIAWEHTRSAFPCMPVQRKS